MNGETQIDRWMDEQIQYYTNNWTCCDINFPHDSIHSSYGMSTSSITVSSTNITTPKSPSHSSQYRCLLASEIVHLMCLVPVFFDYLDSNNGKVNY